MSRALPMFAILALSCRGDDGGSGDSSGSATEDGSATGDGDATADGTADATADGTADSTADGTADSTADGTADTTATGDGDGDGDLDACGNAPGQLLPPDMPWNQRVDDAAMDPESQAITDYLQGAVDTDVTFQIDLSITLLEADANTPKYAFQPTGDFYDVDCDPAPIPIPEGGHIEGENAYACENDGDCHLIVIDRDNCRLYEQWRTNFISADEFYGGCLAIWSLDQHYDETLRGDYCTSADAAGLPIAANLFTADEVAAGEIRHALRFAIPNDAIRADIMVRPATHSTPATSGPADAPPYGARLRLRSDFPVDDLPDAARVIAIALQQYGMIMSDGGNVTLMGADDDFDDAKWDQLGLGTMDLEVLEWTDFEVVDGGERIDWTQGSCERTPIEE